MKQDYTTWQDARKEFLRPEQIALNDIRVEIAVQLMKARKEKGITQKELEKLSGLTQSAIARMERGDKNTGIETITKALVPLGMKLAVVPID